VEGISGQNGECHFKVEHEFNRDVDVVKRQGVLNMCVEDENNQLIIY